MFADVEPETLKALRLRHKHGAEPILLSDFHRPILDHGGEIVTPVTQPVKSVQIAANVSGRSEPSAGRTFGGAEAPISMRGIRPFTSTLAIPSSGDALKCSAAWP